MPRIHDTATGLGHPIGRHDARAGFCGSCVERAIDPGSPDEDRPEPAEIRSGVEQPGELCRHQRCEAHVAEPGHCRAGEAAPEGDRGTDEQVALQHQQSPDMRQGQAGKPPILGASIDGGGRGEHRGLHRGSGKLGEPGMPGRAGGCDHERDDGIDGRAIRPTDPLLVGDQRRSRHADELSALASREADVDRKQCRPRVAGMPEQGQPRGPRPARDSHQIPGTQGAAEG